MLISTNLIISSRLPDSHHWTSPHLQCSPPLAPRRPWVHFLISTIRRASSGWSPPVPLFHRGNSDAAVGSSYDNVVWKVLIEIEMGWWQKLLAIREGVVIASDIGLSPLAVVTISFLLQNSVVA
ncbi:hypothetical protein TorRG33x02_008280 [Trema orientale]|uniref:Uncharacterized protein n=1 Tax=Trema orientale TaxID=63057 RepID=A0A2P5G0P2_TREOI|nr:hypothetical protein TorRG33x02_008280 [Trema orientale]